MLDKILKFFSADNKNSLDVEKSQKFNIIVIGVGLFAILFFLMLLVGDDSKQKKDIGEFKIVNENEAVKTKWIGEVAPQVEISNQKVRDVIQQNKKLNKDIEDLKKMIIDMKRNKSNQNYNKFQFNKNNQGQIQNQNVNKTSNLYQKFPMPPVNPKDVGLNHFGKVPVLKKNVIVKEKSIPDALGYANISQPEKEKKTEEEIKPINMISTGSISKVLLLGGMDAPTMTKAKSNPLPVLMKITDPSFLPNDWREDIQGCFFLGEGYGDLSSERAYVRVTTLSCVTKDGYHIDTPFKGAVYGEDGKVGMRGRVVTKQGSLLARTIIAGFLQGVGQAFGNQNQITMAGATGTTTTPNTSLSPEKQLKNAAFQGLANGTNKLAEFYLKMADQVAPIIEISAGRKVDVIALEPIKLKPLELAKKRSKK
jgi:conjugal transfer pilus assembly protein TraB